MDFLHRNIISGLYFICIPASFLSADLSAQTRFDPSAFPKAKERIDCREDTLDAVDPRDNSRYDMARLYMGVVRQALDMFKIHNRRYPTKKEGLDALVEKPETSSNWRGPYIEKEKLIDKWGSRYFYYPKKSKLKKFRLGTRGVDKVEGTSDDLEYGSEYFSYNDKAVEKCGGDRVVDSTIASFVLLRIGLTKFYSNERRLPTSSEGLSVLYESSISGWKGPYVQKKWLRDPYRSKFNYTRTESGYLITSPGSDKILGNSDDIEFVDDTSSWSKILPDNSPIEKSPI